MNEFEQRVLVYAFVGTWSTIVPGLAVALWWFVRRDREAVFSKLSDHERRLVTAEGGLEELSTVVFGHDGASGVNKWEHRVRNLLQPLTNDVGILGQKLNRLFVILARALPNIDLSDLQ